MEAKYKKVYEGLADTDKKAFRDAISNNDIITVGAYVKAAGADLDLFPELVNEKALPESEKYLRAKRAQFRNDNKDYRERREAGIMSPDQLEVFKQNYLNIIKNTCLKYYAEHEEIIKKTPFIWYNSLLYELKQKLPQINIKDSAAVGVAWEAFTGLMYKIGLFPTMEAFTCLTGIYKDQLNRELTPEHIDLKKRIYNDCKDNMQAQVSYNPMTQVNKMFLLKSVYGFNENASGQLTPPDHAAKNLDDIPTFSLPEKES